MINPIWLRTFCTLVETGHFTRTADKLFMTQSGVSQHIRKLENSLSVTLLVRDKKRFTLTDSGRTLYTRGCDILQSMTNLATEVGEDPADAGEVRLMSPGSVGLKLYPRLLDLQQAHPLLALDYRFAPNPDIERALLDDRIDIGLTTRKPNEPGLHWEAVGEESLLLVTPKNLTHPDWAVLQALGFIDHPDGQHHAEILLGANFEEFSQHSFNSLTRRGFSNQIGLILEPVSRGLGFTVLPRHAVEAYPAGSSVYVHELAVAVVETLYLVSLFGREQPARIRTIATEIKKLVGMPREA
ncbi:LysR family transcriptional regulator [Marinobacter xestospongiae]|uniref:LysR family transcriptional regulator n=1 Tax=Marinobacter xestospongiae TaxID=994319 RepID=UPI002006D854|nr:LysR family transcriptional regulator [Marinobacter xestospongiae]MCK7568947.1 LysR family transcriptional regulator [Marinobacter xestospongiae]